MWTNVQHTVLRCFAALHQIRCPEPYTLYLCVCTSFSVVHVTPWAGRHKSELSTCQQQQQLMLMLRSRRLTGTTTRRLHVTSNAPVLAQSWLSTRCVTISALIDCGSLPHNTQAFNGLWSETTWVDQYRKKHSPTYTHSDHQTSFINFFHLLQSIASSLFSLRTWQSFSTTSLHVLFGLPLGLGRCTSYSLVFFTQSSFCYTCPYHRIIIEQINNNDNK